MTTRLTTIAALLFSIAIASAEDIKTLNGTVYKNATVSRAEPDGLVIMHAAGIAKIPFSELAPEIQKKYGYDPVAGTAFRRQSDQAAAQWEQAVADAKDRKHKEQVALATAPAAPSPTKKKQSVTGAPLHGTSLDIAPNRKWAINGTVLSSNDEGILVLCEESGSLGLDKPPDGAAVFVAGTFAAVDDDKVRLTCIETGRYKYQSAGDAAKTVRAFRVAQ